MDENDEYTTTPRTNAEDVIQWAKCANHNLFISDDNQIVYCSEDKGIWWEKNGYVRFTPVPSLAMDERQ